MDRLINIGFGNVVNTGKILSVVSPDAAPVKRMVQRGKEENRVVDATQGRKTKSVIIADNTWLILSALQPDTIMKRFNGMAGNERKNILLEDNDE